MTNAEIQALIEWARGPLPKKNVRGVVTIPNVTAIMLERCVLADALEQLLKERDITDEMVERAMISWHGADGWRALCCNTMRRDKARRRMFAALEAALQPQKPAP